MHGLRQLENIDRGADYFSFTYNSGLSKVRNKFHNVNKSSRNGRRVLCGTCPALADDEELLKSGIINLGKLVFLLT